MVAQLKIFDVHLILYILKRLSLQITELQFQGHADAGIGKLYSDRLIADLYHQMFAEFYDEALLKLRSINKYNY